MNWQSVVHFLWCLLLSLIVRRPCYHFNFGSILFLLRIEFTFNSFHCVTNMSQRSKSFILSVNYMVCIQPAQPHPNTLDYHSNGLVCCCCFMLDLYSEYVAVHASKCWLFIALVYAQQMLFHQNLLYQSHSCVFSFHFCYIKAFWQAKSWYKMTIEFWYEVFFEVQSKRSWTSMMS